MSLSYQTHKVNINLTEKQTLSVNNKIWQKKKKKKAWWVLATKEASVYYEKHAHILMG